MQKGIDRKTFLSLADKWKATILYSVPQSKILHLIINDLLINNREKIMDNILNRGPFLEGLVKTRKNDLNEGKQIVAPLYTKSKK